jgi:hypothetical protein
MKRIIDYKVLRGDTLAQLHDKVNDNILDCWEPLGGICYSPYYAGTHEQFYQAMVRYAK